MPPGLAHLPVQAQPGLPISAPPGIGRLVTAGGRERVTARDRPSDGQSRLLGNGQAAGERVPATWERPGAGLTADLQPAAAAGAAADRN